MDIRALQNQNGTEVKFIKNPLPGPKKHVRKEMGYDIDVPESKMHYDIEIMPGDDFDIE